MADYLNQILKGQFEAALCMLEQCIAACPPEHWEGKIANDSFRQMAYHTLFFVDYYLSRGDAAFELRDLHARGGDERSPNPSVGLSKAETLEYVALCRQKLLDEFAAETDQSLQAPCGLPRKSFSRGELHIYNLRHVQHHAGALSAYLRRVAGIRPDSPLLRWVPSGWQPK